MNAPALPDLGCPLAPPEACPRYAVDGVVPRAVALPATEEQVASVLRVAHAEGLAVTPWGGGTQMALGAPSAEGRLDVVLDMSRLSAVVAHEPADLTVTVQAGATIGAVNAHLARSGQYLPLDPPLADRATIGGTLAADASGPLRQRYGTARDVTLGVRVAGPDGVVTKAGGRVVKNVTGYDLTKLYIGSLGTLGVILEATFKVAPLPRSESTALARFATVGDAQEAALALLRRGMRPLALDIINTGAGQSVAAMGGEATRGRAVLAARFGGTALAVERMEREMLALRQAQGERIEVLHNEAHRRFWRAAADYGWGDAMPPTLVTVASVLPTQVPVFMEAIVVAGGRGGLVGESVARAGVGVVRTFWRAADPLAADASPSVEGRAVSALREYATALGGTLVVEACAPDVKRLVDVWGPPGPDVDVMRRVKAQFDPKGVLNPGRFVGGI
ncbi:MAG: FAD-binding oxidoreductase [Dehalococcoidia bacterium]|nr:FAD-binding oxidoreductase [Dehalococcoidia bacterium]